MMPQLHRGLRSIPAAVRLRVVNAASKPAARVRAGMIPFGLLVEGTALESIPVKVVRIAFVIIVVVIPLVGAWVVSPIRQTVGCMAVVLILGMCRTDRPAKASRQCQKYNQS